MIVTPGQSPILDFGLKLLTGKSAKNDFRDSREKIIPTFKKYFEVKQNTTFPKFKSSPVKIYTGLELVPKPTAVNSVSFGAVSPVISNPVRELVMNRNSM